LPLKHTLTPLTSQYSQNVGKPLIKSNNKPFGSKVGMEKSKEESSNARQAVSNS
jgi:hypothetical protein